MKRIYYIICLIFYLSSLIYASSNNNTKKYNRIISLSSAGDEILFDMVDKKRILAFRGKHYKNNMISILGEKINNSEKVEDNIEKIISLEPDLVIAATWLKKEMKAQLEDVGIFVYTYKNPSTYEEEKTLIRQLSILLDEEKKGNEIILNMDKRLKILQEKIKKLKQKKPRVLEYSHYGGTNGKGSVLDDMLKKIYVINIANEINIKHFAKLSKEKVIDIDPDIILIPIWHNEEDSDNQKFFKFIKEDKSYKNLKAVKNNKIYSIPGKYIYVYSHYMIEAIEELAKKIYNLDNIK